MITLVEPHPRFQRSYLSALEEFAGEHRDGDGELVLPADDGFGGVSFTRDSLEDPAEFAALCAFRIGDARPSSPRPAGWVLSSASRVACQEAIERTSRTRSRVTTQANNSSSSTPYSTSASPSAKAACSAAAQN